MRREFSALASWAVVVGGAFAQDAIPAKTLAEIKSATVFVKVTSDGKSATGSGFVMQVDQGTCYLVTNHHVVVGPGDANPTITVVFRSGTSNEQEVKAELLASDPDKDLAILRAKGVKEPVTIDLSKKPEIIETLPVYLFGFPFGAALDPKMGNPSMTVGKGSVSSVREGRDGAIAAVQIDGNLNPGNSGGPVVDAKGRLVGVAVARVGQGIGLAIPLEHLEQMLHGRVADCVVKPTVQDNQARVRVEVRLIDPLAKIKTVTVYYVASEPGKAAPKPAKGSLAGAAGVGKVEMKVENQLAKSEFTVVAKEPGLVHCACQAAVVNGAGKTTEGEIVDSFINIIPGVASDKLIQFEQQKHNEKVLQVRFAPDGRTLASADRDGVILLWDVEKGWPKSTLKGHTRAVNALAFAPDGGLLASSGSGKDETIRIWDVAAGKELRQWKLPNETGDDVGSRPLAFAPNGRLLAVGGMDNDVNFYDPSSGEKLGLVKPRRDDNDNYIYPVRGLAFSADGKTLAVAAGRTIRLWDVVQRKEVGSLPKQAGGTLRVAWTADGKALAFSTTDGSLALWDVAEGKQRAALTGHRGFVTSLAFTSRNDLLFTFADNDLGGGKLHLWHVASGKELAINPWEGMQWAGCAVLSPDDRRVAVGTSRSVVVLNLDKLREQKPDKK